MQVGMKTIVTKNNETADVFMQSVGTAAVYHNATDLQMVGNLALLEN